MGLSPAHLLAAACEDYSNSLSQEQLDLLEGQGTTSAPEGEVPVIQRCDIDGNKIVDIHDIRAIVMMRNQPAAHPDDPMDWDKNNLINIRDARGCQRACSEPRCATPDEEPEEQVDGVIESADCSQVEDFDGDGKEDFVALYTNPDVQEADGDWVVEVVIVNEDPSGAVNSITYPYSGMCLNECLSEEEAAAQGKEPGILLQHLSVQPAGEVDLNPGFLVIDEPGIVSYRNGRPRVLYYFIDGEVHRAFYNVND